MYIEISSPTIISQEYFTVSVYDPSITNETPYLTDVVLQFNDEIYTISSEDDSGEILIQAPDVLVNTSYHIQAYKEGYTPTNKTILVMPGEPIPSYELHITILEGTDTLDAYTQFTVLITDLDGTSIENATVEIQGFEGNGYANTTDIEGKTTLTVPNIKEITILTKKQGYKAATITTWVTPQLDSFDLLLNHTYLPIAIAAIILITVIIYVSTKNRIHASIDFAHHTMEPSSVQLSKKKHIETNEGQPEDNPSMDQQAINKDKIDPKIEEIHIPSSRSRKEVVSLDSPKGKKPDQSSGTYHWFEKSTEIDNKVDKLPETSHKKRTDTWFVGTDDIQKKIDENLRMKDKKKEKG
jgi:hypothetical protein